ncbi:MAG: twitch domain-containing radical SAM protein [Bdellovibrionales bacterium]
MKQKTICILPWIHFSSSTDGYVRNCCYAKPSMESIENRTLKDVRGGDYLDSVRRRMLAGEKLEECSYCHTEESHAGLKSKRVRENAYWSIKEEELTTAPLAARYLELRLSSRCNLRCLMCNAKNSSSLSAETPEILRAIKTLDSAGQHSGLGNWLLGDSVGKNLTVNDQTWKSILASIETVEKVYFAGGEPLFDPFHEQFLEACIDSGRSQMIILRYSTNGTQINEKLIEKWAKFKGLDLSFSVDGCETVNNYIRYPSKWGQVEGALKLLNELPNIVKFGFDTTVQALNIFDFVALKEWALSKPYYFIQSSRELQPAYFHLLHEPNFLSVQALPEHLKVKAKSRIIDWASSLSFPNNFKRPIQNRLQGLVDFMMAKQIEAGPESIRLYLSALDRIRGTRHEEVFQFLFE